MDTNENATRLRLLDTALKRFADHGYAGTSVQDIVDDARVTKPTLYYYFGNKAGLYQALVNHAHDERFKLMQLAEQRASNLESKLTEILTVLFEFLQKNRELMRIAFATVFAAPGEIPEEIKYMERANRNFEFVHSLVKQGQEKGELRNDLDSTSLVMGFFGYMNVYVMTFLVRPDSRPTRKTAEQIVQLFMNGARAK